MWLGLTSFVSMLSGDERSGCLWLRHPSFWVQRSLAHSISSSPITHWMDLGFDHLWAWSDSAQNAQDILFFTELLVCY